mmetsp:Transcript_50713/g.91479  ORF Transcript_50713/g.91479 Transcript_50713/m.91479 type:complete len:84 (+) Transcript_50713:922-1173(+)
MRLTTKKTTTPRMSSEAPSHEDFMKRNTAIIIKMAFILHATPPVNGRQVMRVNHRSSKGCPQATRVLCTPHAFIHTAGLIVYA